ncbi:MAG TPA: FixH family protein, partial [Flavobacterium sp.]|nr:FixH family protein [Flavobacterium sp.]
EYYKHDAKFGDEMARIQNVEDLAQKPTINIVSNGVEIVFPKIFVPKNIKGKVSLYRPSNKKLDFQIPISLSDATTLLIPIKSLVGGRWGVNMEWQYDGKSYLSKETIYIN